MTECLLVKQEVTDESPDKFCLVFSLEAVRPIICRMVAHEEEVNSDRLSSLSLRISINNSIALALLLLQN